MSQRAADAEIDAWLGFIQTLRLVSIDPNRNCARVYILTWQPTLWGEVALIRTWGRLDHPGHTQMQTDLRRLIRRRFQHGYTVVASA